VLELGLRVTGHWFWLGRVGSQESVADPPRVWPGFYCATHYA